MFKKFANDFKLNFFRKIILSVSFLLSIKIYTRYLSKEDFGTYSTLIFIITLFSMFATGWLSSGYVRFLPIYLDSKNILLNTVKIILSKTLFFLLPLFIILLFIMDRFGVLKIDYISFIIILISFLSQAIFNVLEGFFIAERRLSEYSVYTILQFIISFSISFILIIYVSPNYLYIFLGNIISQLIIIGYIFKFKLDIKSFSKSVIDKVLVGEMIKYSTPLLLLNAASFMLISFDQIILKYYGFHEQVGIYAANYLIIDKSLTVSTKLLTSTYTPLLFSVWEKESQSEAYAIFKKIRNYYIAFSLIFVVLFYLGYNYFAGLILNTSYIDSSILIFILIGSYAFNISNVYSELFTLKQNTKALAYCFIIPLIINILGNILIIPHYNIKGAAIMTAISYTILVILVVYNGNRIIKKT